MTGVLRERRSTSAVPRSPRARSSATGVASTRRPGRCVPGQPNEAAPTPPVGPDAGRADVAADLEAQLAERTADLQRLQAEYANYRRRVERDRQAVGEAALASVFANLLPVLDDIDRARAHGEVVGGFARVADGLEATLTKLGLERFGDAGEPFDPTLHEALTHGFSAEVAEPVCAEIFQAGYRVGERVLRPARVAVLEPSAAPSTEAATIDARRRNARSAGRRRRHRVTTPPGMTDSVDEVTERRDARERPRLRREGLLRGARRLEGSDSGRDQEGLPQAGPQVSPRRQRRRRQGRGEVQGGLRGLRRALRPDQAQGVRRGPLAVRQRWLPGAARRRCTRWRRAARPFDLGDLFGGGGAPAAAPVSATCSAASSVAAGVATPRPVRAAVRTPKPR